MYYDGSDRELLDLNARVDLAGGFSLAAEHLNNDISWFDYN